MMMMMGDKGRILWRLVSLFGSEIEHTILAALGILHLPLAAFKGYNTDMTTF